VSEEYRPRLPAREVVFHPDADSAFVARVRETVPILAKATNEELEPIITVLRHTTNPEAIVVMHVDRIDVFRDTATYRQYLDNSAQ
jgi:hypothetical protein